MYDLSEFMKTLKQRFSFWFNKSHERGGPLWNGRFKSVLVESPACHEQDFAHNAITTMAAYIDLNPVRAGLVDDPKDYRLKKRKRCWLEAVRCHVGSYYVVELGISVVVLFLAASHLWMMCFRKNVSILVINAKPVHVKCAVVSGMISVSHAT